jgi:hypothetical protein
VVTTGAGAPRDSWFSPKIEVRTSSVEGRGSFAVQRIDPGEVVEVWGERSEGKLVVTYTTDRGLAERARAKGKDVMQWDDDLYSLEERGADEGYFLNHSCDSNLWFKDAFTLLARRGAEPGEELTIDCALFEGDEAFRASWHCRCGTENCRGTVTGRVTTGNLLTCKLVMLGTSHRCWRKGSPGSALACPVWVDIALTRTTQEHHGSRSFCATR